MDQPEAQLSGHVYYSFKGRRRGSVQDVVVLAVVVAKGQHVIVVKVQGKDGLGGDHCICKPPAGQMS